MFTVVGDLWKLLTRLVEYRIAYRLITSIIFQNKYTNVIIFHYTIVHCNQIWQSVCSTKEEHWWIPPWIEEPNQRVLKDSCAAEKVGAIQFLTMRTKSGGQLTDGQRYLSLQWQRSSLKRKWTRERCGTIGGRPLPWV